jgi:BlaI family penicillinase repressor
MPRRRSRALTDAEARVMSVLWQRQRASVADVVAALKKRRPVSYSTVQTILRILEGKGYVAHQKVERAFIYRPRVDERQARRRALRHLVARLFNGSPGLLVLNVLEDNGIEPDELNRLKKLIEDALNMPGHQALGPACRP